MQIYALLIFNGNKTLGQRLGQGRKVKVVTQDLEMADRTDGNIVNKGDSDVLNNVELNEDDGVADELGNIIDFMDNLTTSLDE